MEVPFKPPTDYYYSELAPIDEKICSLLAKRKELSNENPGYPNFDLISEWSQKFGLNEDWLRRIFAVCIIGEERFQPPVEPTGFLKFVPILKYLEKDNIMYSITHMKQYTNASIVFIETEVKTDEPFVRLGHAFFELKISPEFQCRLDSGSGRKNGIQHSFVVIPPLPDDVEGLEFLLTVKPHRETLAIQEVFLTETTVTIK